MGRFGQIGPILTHDHGRLRVRDGGEGAGSSDSALVCARPYFAGRSRHVVAVSTEDHMTETIAPPETQADHEILIALHEMAKQQLDILNGQDRVLAILNNFASKDMPGGQTEIQDCVNKILATVEQHPGAGQPAAG
jgi:hypothetical protein